MTMAQDITLKISVSKEQLLLETLREAVIEYSRTGKAFEDASAAVEAAEQVKREAEWAVDAARARHRIANDALFRHLAGFDE